MQFVALISGGKDSLHSLFEATLNNHTLAATATLLPKENKEIDSFMY